MKSMEVTRYLNLMVYGLGSNVKNNYSYKNCLCGVVIKWMLIARVDW